MRCSYLVHTYEEIPKEKKKVNVKPRGNSVSYFKLPNENKKMSYRIKNKKENS